MSIERLVELFKIVRYEGSAPLVATLVIIAPRLVMMSPRTKPFQASKSLSAAH